MLGGPRLVDRPEVGDVGEQARQAQGEPERCQAGCRTRRGSPCGRHQRRLDAQPRRRIELVADVLPLSSHDCIHRCQRRVSPHSTRAPRSRPEDVPIPHELTAAEAEAFADRCRQFLAATRQPPDRRNVNAGRAFQARLAEAGLAGLTYPEEYGGAGLTLEHERSTRRGPGLPAAGRRVRDQPRHVPADAQRVRHRGAEAAVHARQHRRRDAVVPDVLRAGRRLRRRQPPDPGRARRRRVGAQRPEGVDHAGPRVRLRHPHRPHRPRAAQARRDLDVHRRHARARRRDPADPPDRRRSPLQRGVLHRRPRSRPTGCSAS